MSPQEARNSSQKCCTNQTQPFSDQLSRCVLKNPSKRQLGVRQADTRASRSSGQRLPSEALLPLTDAFTSLAPMALLSDGEKSWLFFPKQFIVGVFNAFLVCPPRWACLFHVFGVVSHLVFHLACCVCLPGLVSQLVFHLVSELVCLPGQFLSLGFRWQQNEKMTISIIPEKLLRRIWENERSST